MKMVKKEVVAIKEMWELADGTLHSTTEEARCYLCDAVDNMTFGHENKVYMMYDLIENGGCDGVIAVMPKCRRDMLLFNEWADVCYGSINSDFLREGDIGDIVFFMVACDSCNADDYVFLSRLGTRNDLVNSIDNFMNFIRKGEK